MVDSSLIGSSIPLEQLTEVVVSSSFTRRFDTEDLHLDSMEKRGRHIIVFSLFFRLQFPLYTHAIGSLQFIIIIIIIIIIIDKHNNKHNKTKQTSMLNSLAKLDHGMQTQLEIQLLHHSPVPHSASQTSSQVDPLPQSPLLQVRGQS